MGAGGGDGVGEEVGDPAGPGDQYRGTPPLRSKKPQRPRSHNITEQVQPSEDTPPPLPPKRQSPAVASRLSHHSAEGEEKLVKQGMTEAEKRLSALTTTTTETGDYHSCADDNSIRSLQS